MDDFLLFGENLKDLKSPFNLWPNSDFDILRSSVDRMGKMGGGPVTGPPGPTTICSGRTFERVATPGSDPLSTGLMSL